MVSYTRMTNSTLVTMFTQNRKYRIGGYRPGKKSEDAKIHHTGRFDGKRLPPKVDLRKYILLRFWMNSV